MRDETAKDNHQTAALISHDLTRINELDLSNQRKQPSAIHCRKFHADDVSVNFIILNKLSFAVTKGLYQECLTISLMYELR